MEPMAIFVLLIGAYMVWFSLRISMFNYPSQKWVINEGKQIDKIIYWGSVPITIFGMFLVLAAIG